MSTSKPKGPPRPKAKPSRKPIELYFWPTPNGQKVSIMLEECRLPYRVVPVNIARGEQGSQSRWTGYDVDELIEHMTRSAKTGQAVDVRYGFEPRAE